MIANLALSLDGRHRVRAGVIFSIIYLHLNFSNSPTITPFSQTPYFNKSHQAGMSYAFVLQARLAVVHSFKRLISEDLTQPINQAKEFDSISAGTVYSI
jgi:hypothetical protein